ncbi:Resistance protein RGC2 [Corchorus capsularis]|uniref:Resistance protein RGC2 n=1 Tax=Corchorus capsularis TaxID=210143 RepID=A0A1R3GWD9_COCAP|nr:Resistance protein RGC2 [Corchorus capsularis]
MARRLEHLQQLEIFWCGSLREIIISTDQGNIEDDIMTQIFPKLESLKLCHLQNLKRFCRGNQLKFSCLKTLQIWDCPSFKTFVSDSIMGIETHDDHIGEGNKSLEIDDHLSPLFNEKAAFPMLKDVKIDELRELKRIWDDQQAVDSFCNLETLSVSRCSSLLSIFPFNMSGKLQKLRNLEISACHSVREIIEGEGINGRESNNVVTTASSNLVETIPQFEFPQLTSLGLFNLPKLKSLYRKMHTTKLPSLEEILVSLCNNVEILFAANISGDDDKLKDRNNGQGEERRVDIQPLFWTTKDNTFHRLKELILRKNYLLREIWYGQHTSALFNNLTTLEVTESHQLESLLPYAVSLENLTILTVSNCNGRLKRLIITLPTAKSMSRLEGMSITDCNMIQEIIACESETQEVITFADLKFLQLGNLPSLLTFCSGSVALKFLSLEEVIVRQCPYMMSFSQQKSSAPLLKRVRSTCYSSKVADQGRWDDNLDNTIQQMFIKEVGSSKHLKLSESSNSELIEIWTQNPQGTFDFKSLVVLEICDCNTLTCLFTISMALDLPHLNKIKVKDAKLMEHIIVDERLDEEVLTEYKTISIFLHLESITLESCLDLTSFYKGSRMLEFPSLKEITVNDCPQMFAFAYTVSREQIVIEKTSRVADVFVAPFFNDKVVLRSLEELQLCPFIKKTILPSNKLQKLSHEQLPKMSYNFLNLKILVLEGFNFLNYVFPYSVAENFVHLEVLIIRDCENVKEVIAMDKFEVEGRIMKVFPRLDRMSLRHLPKLVRFCYGDSIEFPMLGILWMDDCPEFTTFVTNFMIGDEFQVDPNIGRNNSKVDDQCLFNDKTDPIDLSPRSENLKTRNTQNPSDPRPKPEPA